MCETAYGYYPKSCCISFDDQIIMNIKEVKKSDFIDAMEENQKDVRKMVMDSYHDIEKGKGRDYKEFFAELESRYRNANV